MPVVSFSDEVMVKLCIFLFLQRWIFVIFGSLKEMTEYARRRDFIVFSVSERGGMYVYIDV